MFGILRVLKLNVILSHFLLKYFAIRFIMLYMLNSFDWKQFKVLQIVGAELFNRYDSILLKDTLNNMTDLVYCPRADCQCAVIPVKYELKLNFLYLH